MRIVILFASTSGSSRLVVQSVIEDLGAVHIDSYDIAVLDTPLELGGCDLLLLVTPTYGIGDWHSAWEEKGMMLLSTLPTRARVALLALGDSRGHKLSFAGGIGKLAALARSRHAKLVGSVPSSDYSFQSSPAVENGRFPGLVVEYRKNRHYATSRAREWVRSLVTEIERDTDRTPSPLPCYGRERHGPSRAIR